MSTWRTDGEPDPDPLSAYLSLIDAGLLVRQFTNRHCPGLALSMEQRKAWAAEMILVMEALCSELQRRLPQPYNSGIDHVPWNLQMRAGLRPVTYKRDATTQKSS